MPVGKRVIVVRTVSGRTFRFDITEYPVSAETTPHQIDVLADQIVAAKYRYSSWDKAHPYVNVQKEMLAEVKHELQKEVDRRKRLKEPPPANMSPFETIKRMLDEATGISETTRTKRKRR